MNYTINDFQTDGLSDYSSVNSTIRDLSNKSAWYCFCYLTYDVNDPELTDNLTCWLSDLHLGGLWVSPVHNADGKEGKPHRHIVIEYTVKHGKDWARFMGHKMIEKGVANGVLLPCNKLGMLKYLCHLENPDKEQFDISEVITIFGDQYEEIIKNSDQVTMSDIITDIKSLKVTEYCDLMDFYAFNGYSNRLKYCVTRCYAIQSYFQSIRNCKSKKG